MRFRIALTALALLVFGMSGVAGAQPAGTGTLVFVHNIPADALGPDVDLTVELAVFPFNVEANAVDLGDVAPGETTAPEPLPVGDHTLEVFVPALEGAPGVEPAILAPFSIVAGGTTTVTAQLNAQGLPVLVVSVAPAPSPSPSPSPTVSPSPTASPSPATASPRPQTITVPTRVETGAGGSTTEGAGALVLGGLAAAGAVAGMLVLGLRRRSA